MITPLSALGADLPSSATRSGETADPPPDGGFQSTLNAQMGEAGDSGLQGVAQAYAAGKPAARKSVHPDEPTPAPAAGDTPLPDALLAATILPPPLTTAPPSSQPAPSSDGAAAPSEGTASTLAPALPSAEILPGIPSADPALAALAISVPGSPASPTPALPASSSPRSEGNALEMGVIATDRAAPVATTVSSRAEMTAPASPPENLPTETATPATERQTLPSSPASFTSQETAGHLAREAANLTTAPASAPGAETGIGRPLDTLQRPPATQMVHMTVESPVRSPAFSTDFADKVVWMAGKQEQWAELSLNPANLGSVEVRLSLTGDGAGAQFFSANPQVREALEASLPRLRELLAQSGIALQDASVHDQSLPQRDGSGERGWTGGRSSQRLDEPTLPAPHALPRTQTGRGLVDLYA